ncbi:hypothetical protein CEXT_804331 [Caerostris extrusa]|uniref:Cytochrome P450 n=1 Tax=Caerostris extrusa TaxID=172846 RepID=A0AAV4XCI9_CAEEX|nr:hypothetical protein CEXT_804331 [Caerostris extrusa]
MSERFSNSRNLFLQNAERNTKLDIDILYEIETLSFQDQLIEVTRYEGKYGNVISVKMGTKYVVFLNEYNVLKEVWNHPYGLDKAPDLFAHLKPAGLLNANGEDWAEQRKYCLAASKDLGLGKDHWEDLIMDETTSFVEYLQKLNGKPTEISHELVCSVITNIGSLLIGRRLDKEKEADKLELLADYSNVALLFSGSSALANLIPGMRKLLRILKISGYDKAAKTVKDFGKFVR